jgi:hypothetical protein
MAGAAKRRHKIERQVSQAVSRQLAEPSQSGSSVTPLPSENPLPGGLDGPSDDRFNSGRPPLGFGPSIGYDPARSSAPTQANVPRRLELPTEAYRDSMQVSSVQINLHALYKLN